MIQFLSKILKKQRLFFIIGFAIAMAWLGVLSFMQVGGAVETCGKKTDQVGVGWAKRTCAHQLNVSMGTSYGPLPILRPGPYFSASRVSHPTTTIEAKATDIVIAIEADIAEIPRAELMVNVRAADLLTQGQRDFDAGDIEAALDSWRQALEIVNLQDQHFHGVLLNHMAIAHQRLGQWSEAETAIEAGLTVTEIYSDLPYDRQQRRDLTLVRAQLLNTQGRLEWSLGRADTALDTWQQATELYKSIDDTTGVVGSQINQVQAMESLGYYRQACDRILEVLAIGSSPEQSDRQNCQELGISRTAEREAVLQQVFQSIDTQSNPQLKLLGLRSLGNVLRLTGQLDTSHQVLLHALDAMGSRQMIEQRVLTLLSLGTTDKARYQRAKTLYSRTKLSGDRTLTAQFAAEAVERYDAAITSSNSFAGLQAQLQKLALLIDLEEWNQQVQQSSSLDPFLPPTNFSEPKWPAIAPIVVSLLRELPPMPPALKRDPGGINIFSLFGPGEANLAYPVSRQTIDAYLGVAQQLIRLPALQLQLQLQNQDQDQGQSNWLAIAQQLASTAVAQADQLADVRSQSYAYGILGHIYEMQDGAIAQAQALTLNALSLAQSTQSSDITYRWQWQLGRLAEQQQQEEEAIAYYEAAVKTLDTVRSNLLNIDADVQFSFRDDVEPIYRRLVELLLAQNNGQPSQNTLRRAIHDIDALQLSELENFLGCNLTASVALSETLVDPTAVVVYPIILKHQLAVITKWPHTDNLQFHTVAISDTELNAKLSNFRRELSRPLRTNTGLQLSQELYTWLLQPVESLLKDAEAKTLVFVLDGKFRNVPMATLHDGEQYIIQEYALALMPGLQLLEPQPLSQKELDVLTFGLSQMRREFPPHRGFEDLNNVEVEVKEIKNQLPSRLFLNQDFTQTTLADRIESVAAPIVHLATHGQFSSEPTDTFVVAWDQRIDINTLSDILQARNAETNPIELLVLSACKTAEGDDRAALGLAGIAVRSGARSTLASLWTVDDKATADMMSQFYRELGQSPEQSETQSSSPIAKAEALRRAQVKLLESDQFKAPRYWAPFILVGNWL
ncbi:MAG: CHAT domain-containing protein [Cyanobacteria bacterium P01_F01_bin.150]